MGATTAVRGIPETDGKEENKVSKMKDMGDLGRHDQLCSGSNV